MGIPLELLQAKVEKQAVVKVVLSYYPGGNWDCELLDLHGNRIVADPERHWGPLVSGATALLELFKERKDRP